MGDGVREGHLSFSSTSATPCRTRQDAPMPPPRSDTYQRLRAYMAERMRMSPIDQPLMLMELLGRRSPAPAQDVARRILGEDVTQIDYTTERVKRMVGKVHLQRHHRLWQRRLQPDRRRRALRAAAAVPPAPRCLPNAARRGGGLFAHAEACGFGHRSRHRTPISGSIKVRAWGRWVGVAPAGMERGGGCGPSIPKPD